MRESTAGVGDHARRNEGPGIAGNELQEFAQGEILRLQLAADGLPLQKPFALGPQAGVLLAQGGQFLALGNDVVDRGDGAGHRVEDGRHRIGDMGAELFDDDHIGLAEHHQAKGRQHQPQIGETLGNTLDRRCDTIDRSKLLAQLVTPKPIRR